MRIRMTVEGPVKCMDDDDLKRLEKKLEIAKAKRMSFSRSGFLQEEAEYYKAMDEIIESIHDKKVELTILENKIRKVHRAMDEQIGFIENDYKDALFELRNSGAIREEWQGWF